MNNIAAAIGLTGMEELDEVVARHAANGAAFYDRAFAGRACRASRGSYARPATGAASGSTRCAPTDRDALLRALHGARASRHRACTCATTPTPRSARACADLPGVASSRHERLCLPCGWWVGDEELDRIVEAVRAGW